MTKKIVFLEKGKHTVRSSLWPARVNNIGSGNLGIWKKHSMNRLKQASSVQNMKLYTSIEKKVPQYSLGTGVSGDYCAKPIVHKIKI